MAVDSTIKLKKVVEKLQEVRHEVLMVEDECQHLLDDVHPNYKYNILNFLRYLRFRTFNLRKIQGNLTALGISSMSHAERHVLANLENTLYLLSAHIGIDFTGKYPFGSHPVNFMESARKLKKNSRRLFGNHIRHTAIMVTLPPQAIEAEFVGKLLISGMQIARINCSHDDRETWQKFVSNVREQSQALDIPCSIYADLSGPKIRLEYVEGENKEEGNSPRVNPGDTLLLCSSIETNIPEEFHTYQKAVVSLPEIIRDVKPTDRILFDDGKIGAIVRSKFKGGLVIEILRTKQKGSKLKAMKGINFPDTHLFLPSLTEADKRNLPFITEHADMLGFSFVRSPKDVEALQDELQKIGRSDIGVILKIENKEAFENLPQLIIQGMKSPTIGVMTARGDLAVELGAERLSEVQEEIMWLCESAMIPNIWATQVLETLTKKGVPTRAEITDAAMSIRAECVMLNKGPHIEQALGTLVNILKRMEKHQHKKLGTLRKLRVAKKFWKDIQEPVA